MKIAVFSSKPYDKQFLDLENNGKHEFTYLNPRLEVETVPLASGNEGVCIFVNDNADRSVLEKLKEAGVKAIFLRCAGFDRVDMKAAKELGFKVYRVPAYSPYAVAEFALALLMSLNRKTHKAYNRVREQNFALEGLLGWDIHGKTIGVLGTGKIGAIFAEIMKGFGVKLIGYDVYKNEEWAKKIGLEYVPLDQLLAESDVISIHVPLLPDTKHIINDENIAKMKKGVFIINTSRGALVDAKAVIAGLKNKTIGGIAMDVYEQESGMYFENLTGEILSDDVFARLMTFPNVIMTGHMAYFTREAQVNICNTTLSNISDFLEGKNTNELTKDVKQ